MTFKTYNFAMPTTAAPVAVGTGTSLKTMLQIAAPSTRMLQVVSWGYTLSAAPGAVSTFELIQTDVAATVTAHVAAGIINSDPNGSASLAIGGVNLTGYTASVEGSTTASRLFDIDQVPTGSGLVSVNEDYQFVFDERPVVAASKFLRVRAGVTGSGVNMICWVSWNEI